MRFFNQFGSESHFLDKKKRCLQFDDGTVFITETSSFDTSISESVSKSFWAKNSSDVGHIKEAESLMTSIDLAEPLEKLTQHPLKRETTQELWPIVSVYLLKQLISPCIIPCIIPVLHIRKITGIATAFSSFKGHENVVLFCFPVFPSPNIILSLFTDTAIYFMALDLHPAFFSIHLYPRLMVSICIHLRKSTIHLKS